ncbi:hypothetical protein V3C99_010771 [Haemonchus contortus]|uniref:Integrase_H2C2 domain-containing protein n=1 Tax=Haemonchus contortus TaxID=6289 RepID=A0A7I4Y757_HAECO
MSKSRLAPLHQSITIPRLELSALTIGAKLLSFIAGEMDFELSRKFLWTDNTVAVKWANSCGKIVPVFVRNRVKTIQSVTSDVIMHCVPTKDNPADIGSRGATLTELQATDKWWNGPDFLMRDETTWPVSVPPTTKCAAISIEGCSSRCTRRNHRKPVSPCNIFGSNTFTAAVMGYHAI